MTNSFVQNFILDSVPGNVIKSLADRAVSVNAHHHMQQDQTLRPTIQPIAKPIPPATTV
jgi:hypothetical protein